jgi:hypothetical protein
MPTRASVRNVQVSALRDGPSAGQYKIVDGIYVRSRPKVWRQAGRASGTHNADRIGAGLSWSLLPDRLSKARLEVLFLTACCLPCLWLACTHARTHPRSGLPAQRGRARPGYIDGEQEGSLKRRRREDCSQKVQGHNLGALVLPCVCWHRQGASLLRASLAATSCRWVRRRR